MAIPAGRHVDDLPKHAVLLHVAQTLRLQTVHHRIEHSDESVGIGLPDTGKTRAEILAAQQIHAVDHCIYRT